GTVERPDRADPGVVHQDVQSAELGHGRFDASLSHVRIGHVADDADYASSTGLDLLSQRLQAILAPRHATNLAALPRKFIRDGSSYAAGGAGNDRAASANLTPHGVFSFRDCVTR